MAAIDFPSSPANGATFTPATGITYRYVTPPGIWTVANGPVDTVIASDLPPANPIPNQLWFNASLAMLYVYYDDGSSQQWVPSMPLPSPGSGTTKLLQTVTFQTGAVASGTTPIPLDDTIPQITEGTQFMTLAITPISAASRLIVTATTFLSHSSVSAWLVAALFRDSAANAVATGVGYSSVATAGFSLPLYYTVVSGSTALTTFRIRGGGNPAGTCTFNGSGAPRIMGGVASFSSIIIQEVL